MIKYFSIALPVSLLVFGQVMSKIGSLHGSFIFIGLGYFSLVIRGIVWIFILRKLPISFAYPFMSLSIVIILTVSYYIFSEPITLYKLFGSCFIVLGVTLIALGTPVREG